MRYTKFICALLAGVLLLGLSSTALQRKSAPQPSPFTQPEPSYTPQEKRSLLHMRYPQVLAWLSLPAVGLEEPVVEAPDDEFYLSHDFTGRETSLGALFLGHGLTLQSPVLLIYGPSNTPGEFFAKLAAYRDPDFFAAHPEFSLAVPEGMQLWQMRWARVLSEEKFHEIVEKTGKGWLLLVTQTGEFPGARLVIGAQLQGLQEEM